MLISSYNKDVTSTLTTLIIDGISSHSIHLDSYVILYAALVASLQRLVGVDFGGSPLMLDHLPIIQK
jgi:nucleolar MIF4G domain-containing protein 1